MHSITKAFTSVKAEDFIKARGQLPNDHLTAAPSYSPGHPALENTQSGYHRSGNRSVFAFQQVKHMDFKASLKILSSPGVLLAAWQRFATLRASGKGLIDLGDRYMYTKGLST